MHGQQRNVPKVRDLAHLASTLECDRTSGCSPEDGVCVVYRAQDGADDERHCQARSGHGTRQQQADRLARTRPASNRGTGRHIDLLLGPVDMAGCEDPILGARLEMPELGRLKWPTLCTPLRTRDRN